MVSHEQLVVAVDTHYRKTVKGLGDLRQSIAADNEEITRKMDELKSLCLQSTGVRLPGPTDPAQVALALETTDKQDAAIKDFGADWLVSVQASPLNSVCAQEDLPARFIKAKESSAAASGMPQPSTLPPPPGLPSVITSAVTDGYPSIGNAASGPVTPMPSPAPAPAVSGLSLPFSAAIAGRHIISRLSFLSHVSLPGLLLILISRSGYCVCKNTCLSPRVWH